MDTVKDIAKQKNTIVEQFGLESVPQHLRTTSGFQYTMIQMALIINAGNFLVPALAVLNGGLSFVSAILSTVIGACIAFIFVSFLALPGAKYGLPAQYAIRSILGINGSRFFASPIRIIASLYWFCVQSIAGTLLIQELLENLFSIHIPFLPMVLTLSLIMAILALIGFEAVKKVSTYFLPIIILSSFIMLSIFISIDFKSIQVTLASHEEDTVASMIFYASLAFVQYIAMVSSSSDITRYAKSAKHGFVGLFFGNLLGFILTAILGASSAVLLGNSNPYIAASQLTNNYFFIGIIFISAMSSMIIVNINNAYTGGFSLLNCIPRLGRTKSAIIFGITAILLSMFPSFVDEAQKYISLLGLFIIPLSAVIVTDFVILKKRTMDEHAFGKSNRYNRSGIMTILFGAFVYFLLPETFSPGFITFILTCIFYFYYSEKMYKEK